MNRIGRDAYLNPFLIFAEPFQFQGSKGTTRRCYASSIYLIESGSGCLAMEDSSIPIAAHTLVYIPALALHTWHSDVSQPLTFRCAYFDWKYTERPLLRHRTELFLMDSQPPLEIDPAYASPVLDIEIQNPIRIDNYAHWHQLFVPFSNYYDTLHRYDQETSLEVQGRFHFMLKHFLEWTQRRGRFYDPRIKEVLAFMEQSLEYEHIYKMVKKIGLSRSYFQTLFKSQIQATPKQYWNQIRINKAKDDLKNSPLSITEIADKYRFSSVHYFSKMFKEHTGETPSMFRSKNIIL